MFNYNTKCKVTYMKTRKKEKHLKDALKYKKGLQSDDLDTLEMVFFFFFFCGKRQRDEYLR